MKTRVNYGETHRRRSPENVVAEVEFLRDTYHPDMLWYAGDVFTIHTRWFYRCADELKRRAIKRPFECVTRGDRMLSVKDHKSRTYPSFATRWTAASVAPHRQLNGHSFNPVRCAKAAATLPVGRLGMALRACQDQ